MRASFRVFLGILILALAAFASWYLALVSNSQPALAAVQRLEIPQQCDVPALAILTQVPGELPGDPVLLAKRQAAERALAKCLADATDYVTREKPPFPGLPPTLMPAPTPIPTLGLAQVPAMPSMVGGFISSGEGLNAWVGLINGSLLEVSAGWVVDAESAANRGPWSAVQQQGAVYARTDGEAPTIRIFPTPSRSGVLHFVAACGSTLVLESADGTIFTFDAEAMKWVENTSACPAP